MQKLYSLVLFFHSWLRWGVLFLGLTSFLQALSGWARGRNVSPEQRHTQLAFVSALDTQVLLGLALYFVFSPSTPKSINGLQLAMNNTALRFYAVEHAVAMLVALVLVHVSSVLSRQVIAPAARHLWWVLGLLISLIIIGVFTPWPFMPQGRPWIRMP